MATKPVEDTIAMEAQMYKEYTKGLRKVVVNTGAQPESDPNGIDPHAPGAKMDAGKARMELFQDFARALYAVGEVATYGADKYSPGGWTHVKDGIQRYTAAMIRHWLDEEIDGPIDPETGLMHAAQTAWNALARLEFMLRGEEE